ncbi:MAG: hypothetical protein IJO16_05875 [Clostridia bacterium]|nr:hypothetical protein [Clostridia bacterium]MBQ7093941.1 hypothetical protein [Clostridia bacterium]
MTILEELFYGNISPFEKYIRPKSKYADVSHCLTKHSEELRALLDKEGKNLYDKIENDYADMNCISEKERFIEGFCLGARIILEIMAYKNSPWISRGE